MFVKDLKAKDKRRIKMPLPKRLVTYHKDMFTAHFYDLIWRHAEAKRRNYANHSKRCSCRIQIDLQPRVVPLIKAIYTKLRMMDPQKYSREDMGETTLDAFSYLLDMSSAIDRHIALKRREKEQNQIMLESKNSFFFVDESAEDCVFCGEALSKKRFYSIPLQNLIYLP